MGETAMEAVLARVSDPTLAGETIKFETTLIVRTSSAGVLEFPLGKHK
jgi:DNA-binding LacI/PurR family transcriptional regulator